ncbi:MAG: thioredoxin domain-containing protein [Candidatus Verstraetearchaeota archaeon]|nr:thioredoxin domain-containing protein [Candidatus Verstraetearchaeota archaeon]
MSEILVEVTDKDFESFLDRNEIAVVEFWDPWCSICSEMAPVYEELARKYAGKAVFGKLNMRESRKVPDEYEVYVTPTFIFFKNGREVHRLGGLMDPEKLEEDLKERLLSP